VIGVPQYKNLGGNSSVLEFDDSDPDAIVVTFRSGKHRNYEYRVGDGISRSQLDTMLSLARAGQGLGSFINRAVKHAYSRRF
jgi:hypothetical protein